MSKKRKKPTNRRPASSQRPLSGKPQQAPPRQTSEARRALERKSAGPLLVLHRMPRWLIPVVMGILLLLGLFIQAAWAGIFIIAIAVFLGWLLVLSWPVIMPSSRAFRVIVIGVVAVVGVMKLMGWT
ncbi:MAG: hypothetical protein H6525_10745 [Actinobacteria bacterium]|nr:hypothetical protein [Actinomycetota bacterium]MCB9413302.1 hypothetical protein [Actinomycetota bacterium]